MTKIEQFKEELSKGYTLKGDSIILGSAKLDGEVLAGAQIKIPLKTTRSLLGALGISSGSNKRWF